MIKLKDKAIFYLKIFYISNSASKDTLKVYLDITDASERTDTIEFSNTNNNVLGALLSDCNINAFLNLEDGCFSECIIMADAQKGSRVITSLKLRFESVDVAIRNLEIRYNVFENPETAKKADIEQFEKLFVDTLSLKRDGEEYLIATVNNINIADKDDCEEKYTDEDIKSMICADIKILKCFVQTEEVSEYLRSLNDMKESATANNYDSLLAIEQKISKLIEDALANVRKYKEGLLTYERKGS